MNDIEEDFYELIKKYTSDYLSFYDKNESLISKKNNLSYHKEKEKELLIQLIETSKKYPLIEKNQIDLLISESISKFNLLIKPNSKS